MTPIEFLLLALSLVGTFLIVLIKLENIEWSFFSGLSGMLIMGMILWGITDKQRKAKQ